MLINPIILIFSAAALIFTVIFCVLNKPKKPVLSGLTLVILLFFLSCTYMIYLMFIAIEDQTFQIDFVEKMVLFITANNTVDEVTLEASFDVFKTIDIFMIMLSVIFLLYDVHTIFLKNNVDNDIKSIEINNNQPKGSNTAQ